MKRALITGITGQDGSYLAEFLLGKPDYEVHGLVRRSSTMNRQRIDHIFRGKPHVAERFHLHYADLADASSLSQIMEQVRPDEVYNLGAQSHVRVSFDPRSPYSCAKLYAHWQTINYREAYDMFACSGILFNHESPRRGESFVTRKITLGAARIKEGLQKKLVMSNLDAKRDWGFAGDYVRAMWMML